MTTSAYMPNVTIEIAFNAGFNTPAASRTWTDVSDYVELAEGITITGGRSDERATSDANHLTLTLDNRDGRFTPGKTTGAYYPNVKLDRPIRVTSVPVDGASSVRFLGFIDEWPVEWEGTDSYAKVTVSASSRLSRLGTVATFKSIIETAILADGPAAYYTMSEPEGSSQANDSSGVARDPMRTVGSAGLPLAFGSATGPGTDGLTAVSMTGGQWLRGQQLTLTGGTSHTSEVFFLRTGLPAATEILLWMPHCQIQMNTAGQIVGAGTLTSPLSYADGSTHHVAVTSGGGTLTLYVDGVSVAVTGIATITDTDPFSTGGTDSTALGAGVPFTGTLSHAAYFTSVLSGTQVATHAAAGLTGFAGDTTSDRLIRYVGFAGVESAAVSAETGQTTVQTVDTTGKQVVELMRLMETTEGGVLFDGRDGLTTFHNRAHRVTRASSYTLDVAQHMVESDYAPKLDRSALANDVTATDTSGRFTARAFDAASQTDSGYASLSIETASEDDDEPLFQASWALYKYKTPVPRVASLSVQALEQVGKTPNCATVMGTTVGDKITVSNQPAQAAASTATYFVEGWAEVYGPESLTFTFNVSPSSPDDTTYVCGDASRGVIGTNPIAF